MTFLCCGCSLRTGCRILGVLDMFLSLLSIFQWANMFVETTKYTGDDWEKYSMSPAVKSSVDFGCGIAYLYDNSPSKLGVQLLKSVLLFSLSSIGYSVAGLFLIYSTISAPDTSQVLLRVFCLFQLPLILMSISAGILFQNPTLCLFDFDYDPVHEGQRKTFLILTLVFVFLYKIYELLVVLQYAKHLSKIQPEPEDQLDLEELRKVISASGVYPQPPPVSPSSGDEIHLELDSNENIVIMKPDARKKEEQRKFTQEHQQMSETSDNNTNFQVNVAEILMENKSKGAGSGSGAGSLIGSRQASSRILEDTQDFFEEHEDFRNIFKNLPPHPDDSENEDQNQRSKLLTGDVKKQVTFDPDNKDKDKDDGELTEEDLTYESEDGQMVSKFVGNVLLIDVKVVPKSPKKHDYYSPRQQTKILLQEPDSEGVQQQIFPKQRNSIEAEKQTLLKVENKPLDSPWTIKKSAVEKLDAFPVEENFKASAPLEILNDTTDLETEKIQVKAENPEVKEEKSEVNANKLEIQTEEPEVNSAKSHIKTDLSCIYSSEVNEEKPETKPEKLEISAEEPKVQTDEPEAKPKKPEISAEEPKVQTDEPEAKPEKPEISAEEPKVQTESPKEPTEKPEVNSKNPEISPSDQSELTEAGSTQDQDEKSVQPPDASSPLTNYNENEVNLSHMEYTILSVQIQQDNVNLKAIPVDIDINLPQIEELRKEFGLLVLSDTEILPEDQSEQIPKELDVPDPELKVPADSFGFYRVDTVPETAQVTSEIIGTTEVTGTTEVIAEVLGATEVTVTAEIEGTLEVKPFEVEANTLADLAVTVTDPVPVQLNVILLSVQAESLEKEPEVISTEVPVLLEIPVQDIPHPVVPVEIRSMDTLLDEVRDVLSEVKDIMGEETQHFESTAGISKLGFGFDFATPADITDQIDPMDIDTALTEDLYLAGEKERQAIEKKIMDLLNVIPTVNAYGLPTIPEENEALPVISEENEVLPVSEFPMEIKENATGNKDKHIRLPFITESVTRPRIIPVYIEHDQFPVQAEEIKGQRETNVLPVQLSVKAEEIKGQQETTEVTVSVKVEELNGHEINEVTVPVSVKAEPAKLFDSDEVAKMLENAFKINVNSTTSKLDLNSFQDIPEETFVPLRLLGTASLAAFPVEPKLPKVEREIQIQDVDEVKTLLGTNSVAQFPVRAQQESNKNEVKGQEVTLEDLDVAAQPEANFNAKFELVADFIQKEAEVEKVSEPFEVIQQNSSEKPKTSVNEDLKEVNLVRLAAEKMSFQDKPDVISLPEKESIVSEDLIQEIEMIDKKVSEKVIENHEKLVEIVTREEVREKSEVVGVFEKSEVIIREEVIENPEKPEEISIEEVTAVPVPTESSLPKETETVSTIENETEAILKEKRMENPEKPEEILSEAVTAVPVTVPAESLLPKETETVSIDGISTGSEIESPFESASRIFQPPSRDENGNEIPNGNNSLETNPSTATLFNYPFEPSS